MEGAINFIIFTLVYLIVTDCGPPIHGTRVIIEAFDENKFNSVINFHCVESIIHIMMAVCGNTGEWIPNPSLFECRSRTSGNLMLGIHVHQL